MDINTIFEKIIYRIKETSEKQKKEKIIHDKVKYWLKYFNIDKFQLDNLLNDIEKYIFKLKSGDTLAFVRSDLLQIIKIVDNIDDSSKKDLVDRIIETIIFSDNQLYTDYMKEKNKENEEQLVQRIQKSVSDSLDKIKQLISEEKIYSLDTFCNNVPSWWLLDNTCLTIDFFDYGDKCFHEKLIGHIGKNSDRELIYVKGSTSWEECVYVTAFELSNSKYKDNVFFVNDQSAFDCNDLGLEKENIYIINYCTNGNPLPNNCKFGKYIIPIDNTFNIPESVSKIELLPRTTSNLKTTIERFVCNYDYDIKNGCSFLAIKKNFYKRLYSKVFINELSLDQCDFLCSLALICEFEERDIDLICNYYFEKKFSFTIFNFYLQIFSQKDKKILESKTNTSETRIYKFITGDENYKELFKRVSRDEAKIKQFYEFSINVINQHGSKYSCSPTLLKGILSSWIRLKNKKSRYFVQSVISASAISNPYYILLLCAIDDKIVYDTFKGRVENASEKSELKYIWDLWHNALVYIVDYCDKKKINDIWDNVLPYYRKNNLESKVVQFFKGILNPWLNTFLLNPDELSDFLNTHQNDSLLFDLVVSFMPHLGSISYSVKPCDGVEYETKQPLYQKNDKNNRKELLRVYIEYAISYAVQRSDALLELLSTEVVAYDSKIIERILKSFDSFSDDEKIKIEIELRRESMFLKKNSMISVSEDIDLFINSINYKNQYSKYVWLFSSDFTNHVYPVLSAEYGPRPILDNEERVRNIKSNKPDGFTVELLTGIMLSSVAKDFDAIISIYLEINDRKYDKEFFYNLIDKTDEINTFVKSLYQKDKDVANKMLTDLCKRTDLKYYESSLPIILSYLPYVDAKIVVNGLQNRRMIEKYFKFFRYNHFNSEVLTAKEIKRAIEDMITLGVCEEALWYMVFSSETLNAADILYFMKKVKDRGDASTKEFISLCCDENSILKKIEVYANSKTDLYTEVIDLEFYYLSQTDIFAEHTISTLYLNERPDFFIELLNKGALYERKLDLNKLFLNRRCLLKGNYFQWINKTIDILKDYINICGLALMYICHWIYYCQKMEGFEFVPVEEMANAVEKLADKLGSALENTFFNEGNCHFEDGGFYLDVMARKLEKEAESIGNNFPKLKKIMKDAAAKYRKDAQNERKSDRYE